MSARYSSLVLPKVSRLHGAIVVSDTVRLGKPLWINPAFTVPDVQPLTPPD
jgi:hypothetical protein